MLRRAVAAAELLTQVAPREIGGQANLHPVAAGGGHERLRPTERRIVHQRDLFEVLQSQDLGVGRGLWRDRHR